MGGYCDGGEWFKGPVGTVVYPSSLWGLLYCRWLPEGNGNQPYIQLVLPQVLRKEFFKELHSRCVAGHMGTKNLI